MLPDGAVDFLFDVSASSPGALVVGTMTRPLLASRWPSYVAVRFRPAGVRAFLAVAARELTDRRVELGALLPEASEWLERIAEPTSWRERVAVLDRVLTGELHRARPLESRVVDAVRRIERARGSLEVEALSRSVGVSRQHLGRLFEREIGIGVKTFARVVRLQSVVTRLSSPSWRGTRPAWAELALDAGFFDQSHFVNDFRSLAGVTPERFFERSISPRRQARESATLPV